MKELPGEVQPEIIRLGVVRSLISKEFRWLYIVILGFLGLLGATLCAVGGYYLIVWNRSLVLRIGSPTFLSTGISFLFGGLLAGVLAIAVWQVWRYLLHLSERAVAQVKSVELAKLKEEDFEYVDKILQIREEKAEEDFKRNVTAAFLIDSFELCGLSFFDPCSWRPRPGTNLLMGRNGYGKSLLLRAGRECVSTNPGILGLLSQKAAPRRSPREAYLPDFFIHCDTTEDCKANMNVSIDSLSRSLTPLSAPL